MRVVKTFEQAFGGTIVKTIELRSTHRGFASQYFWSVFWIVVLTIVNASILVPHAQSEEWAKWYRVQDSVLLAGIGMWIVYAVVVVIALNTLHTALYRARERNVLTSDAAGNVLGKLTCTTYDFPFSRDIAEVAFDRIIWIIVSQSSIDRLCGTGTLRVRLVTYTNAEASEQT